MDLEAGSPAESSGSAPAGTESTSKVVLRNTLFLTLGQALSVPLSIALNAVSARYLGPQSIGYLYLGTTFNSFGLLAVDWGQGGALPGLVATDRSRSGVLLGTSLSWRASMAVVMFLVLHVACRLLGYGTDIQAAVALVWIGYFFSTLVNACQETILGFERTDVTAIRGVGEQLSAVAIVIPILLLGGGLNVVLVGHAAAVLVAGTFVWRSLGRVGVGRLGVSRDAMRMLLQRGTPFVFFNLAMALQPNIDAIFLSKLAPSEVVGWHAAARKLMGPLILPASALIGALYPTLCRLHVTDQEAFRRTGMGAVRATSLVVMPVALGCALYPDIGTTLYSRAAFAQAEDNLRIQAAHLFLMYFTMPIGVVLLAGGKQRQWAWVQSICVLVSAVLDPILVPWFQHRMGNGGVGISVAAVISEVMVVICGILMVPRGFFERAFWRSLALVGVSGVAMAVVARLLKGMNSFLAAPVAVAAYGITLYLTGGLEQQYIDAIRRAVGRRLARFRRSNGA